MKIINEKDFFISDFRNKSISRNNEITEIVKKILDNVKLNKDKAIFEYTKKFDNCTINNKNFQVTKEEIEQAINSCDVDLRNVIEESCENIRNFHKNQLKSGFVTHNGEGNVMGQKIVPLNRVGLYIPGGTASYPSSVLMNAIPAKIAGVKEIIITTPPDTQGKVNKNILLAANIAGVDKIYKVGGAQAIAGFAYGTESIPKVDKIVGPGNAFVAEAKRQVFGNVAIDMVAGPSEILIIADDNANPEILAIDLLSQAEHDKMASAILLTTSSRVAEECSKKVDEIIKNLKRKEIAEESIKNSSFIVVTKSLESAILISEEIAPEHLELQVTNPFDYLSQINNAGSVFLGSNTPESLGDYFSGGNHVLPTSGTARFSSPLSVDDFVKKIQYTYYSKRSFEKVAKKVALFASAEGLQAHAESALYRIKENK